MRIMLMSVAVASIATLAPGSAWAGNKEVAQEIATQLRTSGQLNDYEIKIKFENGTAWLAGRVANKETVAQVLGITRQVPGVDRVVNELTILPAAEQGAVVRPAQFSEPSAMPQPALEPALAATPTDEPKTLPKPYLPRGVFFSQPTVKQSAGVNPIADPAEMAQPVAASQYLPAKKVKSTRQVSQQMAMPQQMGPQMAYPQGQPQMAYQGQPQMAYPQGQPQMGYPQGQPQMMQASYPGMGGGQMMHQGHGGGPIPAYPASYNGGHHGGQFDQPNLPCHAWPSYAAYPNYAAVTYPRQYSPTAWPFIGPFYPYPQVPLGWRKVTLEWDDGWWWLDFKDR